jgi:hypothetical protein
MNPGQIMRVLMVAIFLTVGVAACGGGKSADRTDSTSEAVSELSESLSGTVPTDRIPEPPKVGDECQDKLTYLVWYGLVESSKSIAEGDAATAKIIDELAIMGGYNPNLDQNNLSTDEFLDNFDKGFNNPYVKIYTSLVSSELIAIQFSSGKEQTQKIIAAYESVKKECEGLARTSTTR